MLVLIRLVVGDHGGKDHDRYYWGDLLHVLVLTMAYGSCPYVYHTRIECKGDTNRNYTPYSTITKNTDATVIS